MQLYLKICIELTVTIHVYFTQFQCILWWLHQRDGQVPPEGRLVTKYVQHSAVCSEIIIEMAKRVTYSSNRVIADIDIEVVQAMACKTHAVSSIFDK